MTVDLGTREAASSDSHVRPENAGERLPPLVRGREFLELLVHPPMNGVQGVPGSNPGVPTNFPNNYELAAHRVVHLLYGSLTSTS
jgi:hypothetical protein